MFYSKNSVWASLNWQQGLKDLTAVTQIVWYIIAWYNYYDYKNRWIGDLHDGVIWLQLPESFTFSVSYAN